MDKLKLPIVPKQRDKTEVKRMILFFSEASAWFAGRLNQRLTRCCYKFKMKTLPLRDVWLGASYSILVGWYQRQINPFFDIHAYYSITRYQSLSGFNLDHSSKTRFVLCHERMHSLTRLSFQRVLT